MARDIDTDEIEDEAEAEAGEELTPDMRRLRKRLKEVEQENKTLREADLKHTFRQAGFDPEKGEGKLLHENYRGERTPEAIKEWAEKEYGIKPSAEEEAPVRPPRSESEQKEIAFEARLARARQEAVAPNSDEVEKALEDARKRGDVAAEIALGLYRWEQTK